MTQWHTDTQTHLSGVKDTTAIRSGLLWLVCEPVSEGDGGLVNPPEDSGVAAHTGQTNPHIQKLSIWWTKARTYGM